MSSPRTILTAVAAWLVVVALGSTLVWTVISRAGEGIVPTIGPGVAATTTAPGTGRPSPTRSEQPSDRPAAPARRTWQGPGGLVTVECRGSVITLVATSADAGFTVAPGSRGPDEVRVGFEGQGEEGRESDVRAHCLDGTPDFEVDARDD